jgi:Domain of unknown function (DUF4124)
MRPILIAIALATFAPAAVAQNIYRYSDPSGRVIYTDDPTAGNGTAKRVEIPSQPSQPGAKPASGLSEAEKKLLEQADKRLAELDRATADIVTAFNALRATEARREQGVEPLEGERSGRRYRPEYWERQQALQRDVEDARARLDDALTRRNALR